MTTTTPQPMTATEWVSQLGECIAHLRDPHPAFRRLAALADNPPAGADVFAALRAACAAIGTSANAPDPDAGQRFGERAGQSHAYSLGVTAAQLITALTAAVNLRLDAHEWAGPETPVRRSDFGRSVVAADIGLVGWIDSLPEGHPGRAVEPFVWRQTHRLLLLDSAAQFEPLSAVAARTAAAIAAARWERERSELVNDQRLALERAAHAATPEGVAERLRAIERMRALEDART